MVNIDIITIVYVLAILAGGIVIMIGRNHK